MNNLTDWHEDIKQHPTLHWVDFFRSNDRYIDRNAHPVGSFVLRRRSKRRFRTRYVVCVVTPFKSLEVTNGEIRYRKSKKVWGIFIDGVPVRHYLSIKAAKLALMPGVLDRMAAEGHRCLDPPCSAPSSKIEA